jgi:deoxycytidylate deaminase
MSEAANSLFDQGVNAERLAQQISERLSQELVFAFVGPVGSGVSTAAEILRDHLAQEFHYNVAPIIKPSDIIRVEAFRVGLTPPGRNPLSTYIHEMQTAGNMLREKFGPNYLAEKVVEKIALFRRSDGGYKTAGERDIHVPDRRAYVIDSIKNREELNLLREIYQGTLVTIGVFAPDRVRRARLIDDGADAGEVQKILDRDQGEVVTFGQMTRNIFVEADFFICNDIRKDEIRTSLLRFLDLLFDTGVHTPTRAESAMYAAEAAASSSACMSRQVGAAIVSEGGELISVGWNDVPKNRGGLYSEDDSAVWDEQKRALVDNDHRCFKWGGKICHNETRRENILNELAAKLAASELVKSRVKQEEIRQFLAGTAIDSIIEYSRSIHAEMEAILAVAREGRHSLVGATLYTTTYPCHNCARHIVAAGIRSVVYIKPYRKSLAIALHKDAITEDREDSAKVVFRQYAGVSPRVFQRLFNPVGPRKRNGLLSRTMRSVALPTVRIPLDGSIEYEAKVIADLSQKEQTA